MPKKSAKPPRVVLVTRPTWLQQLLARHGTREQARFFLETRGQSIADAEQQHRQFQAAQQIVLQSIPVQWRRSRVDRADLDRFLFEPDDVIVALGQDGLVANTAKYLDGQLVIGLNPSPDRYEGILVPFPPQAAGELMQDVAAGKSRIQSRTMVSAETDDGQRLLALNEVFVGHQTHQSARYEIVYRDRTERHSSSGVIVATGTGSTGWARSIHRERKQRPKLPEPEEPRLVFFVREAWPSIATQAELTSGPLAAGESLRLVSRIDQGGVIFGDGIEDDRIDFHWGRSVELQLADVQLRLVSA